MLNGKWKYEFNHKRQYRFIKELSISNLFFLHGLKDFDYALVVIRGMNSFKNFAIFSSANLPHNFVILLLSAHTQTNQIIE